MSKSKDIVKFETTLVTSAGKPVYHFLLVEKEWVAPLGFTFTNLRNISPEPVATSSIRMPSLMPDISNAARWAFEWKKNVEAG